MLKFNVALFEPEIPQNAGTILRLASCLSFNVDIIIPCKFILNDKNFKRAGMDYLNDVSYTLHDNFEAFFKKYSFLNHRIILATTKASNSYTNFSYQENDIILFGSESRGVPDSVADSIKDKIKINMAENKRSLNLAVSCSMIAGEAIRQINLKQ